MEIYRQIRDSKNLFQMIYALKLSESYYVRSNIVFVTNLSPKMLGSDGVGGRAFDFHFNGPGFDSRNGLEFFFNIFIVSSSCC